MSGLLKGDIVNGCYSQLRISGLTVNPSPSDTQLALVRLENIAAELELGRNFNLDYNFALGGQQPDSGDVHNVPLVYHQMLETHLATSLPDFNKVIPIQLTNAAASAMSTASGVSARENLRQVPYPNRHARGSGNTNTRGNRWQRYFRPAVLPESGPQTNEMVIGDVNNYFESFAAYLNAGETIASFVFTQTDGLQVTNTAISEKRITYTVKALDPATPTPFQQVKIVMTTSSSRVETRFQDFEITDNRLISSN